jgi:hypothetical protein
MNKKCALILVLFWFLVTSECFAARYLLLTRLGKKGSIEFRDGDHLRYKLKGDDQFHRSLILGFSDSTIIFNSYQVPLRDIEVIDIRKESFGGFQWAQLGFLGIISGGLFLVIDSINNDFSPQTGIISGSLVGSGVLLTQLKKRRFRPGKKNKMEIINI